MTDGDPAEVVRTSTLAALIDGVPSPTVAAAGVVALTTVGLVVGAVSAIGVAAGVGGTVLLVGVPLLCLYLALWVGGEVRFHPDHVRTGGWFQDGTSIDYDDVEVAIRTTGDGDGPTGAATFRLLELDGETRTIAHVADPDAVERALGERVRSPREQVAAGTDPERGHFWRYWPEELATPRTAVLGEAELEELLDVELVRHDLQNLPAYAEDEAFEDLTDLPDARPDPVGSVEVT